MSYKLDESIAHLPQTVNALGRKHWAVKKKESDLWNCIFKMIGTIKGIPKQPIKKAKLTLIRFSSREPDYDGLVSSFKVVIDALRHNRFIADDKTQNIGIPLYQWEKCKPKEGKIRVVIEELAS